MFFCARPGQSSTIIGQTGEITNLGWNNGFYYHSSISTVKKHFTQQKDVTLTKEGQM
uniref:Uncharacterized protein n=1 Tax=Arundo donax TaxID=35708 RepID=A0A0A9EZX1_ARUDO